MRSLECSLNAEHPSTPLRAGRILNTLSLLTLLLLAGSARATEYFVATNGLDTGAYDGLSWAQPFKTISNAVAKADADVVTVSNGTYNIGAEILLSTNIRVRSFQGGLSGASNTVVQRNANNTRVFHITHTNAVIEGLTIRGGRNVDGAGVFMTGGLVRDCIVTDNWTGGGQSKGGNFYMAGPTVGGGVGGTVSNCIITAGYAGGRIPTTAGGCGIFAGGNNKILYCQVLNNFGDSYSMAAGILAQSTDLIRNCLIAGNNLPANSQADPSGRGGGVYGGKVENCTIVSNTCGYGRAAGGAINCAYVSNSIVYGNYAWGDSAGTFKVADNYSGGSFAYSCTTPLPAGAGNTAVEPKFVNAAGGDYRLLLPGPMVDKGSNQTWMAGAPDLAGAPRITNAVGTAQIVDMGAYEYVPGALKCSLAADVTSVLAPSQVVFTAYVAGTNLNVTYYGWDFGDGKATNGASLAVVTNVYDTTGLRTVTLTVSNDANEAFTVANANYISVWGATVYVWTNSPSPMVPYATWATAARKIQDVVGNANTPAGVTNCWVTNGTYNIVSELVLSTPIRVHSVQGGLSGASNTIVKQTASGQSFTRVFRITHTNAVIEGLTITGGRSADGAGVFMTGGLVRDCIVTDNRTGGGNGTGGNFYMAGPVYGGGVGGTVSNCIISAGYAGGRTPTQFGGCNIFAGGNNQILNCQILNASPDSYSMAGGVLAQSTDLIRNCLIANNTMGASPSDTHSGKGAGIYGGKVENCTIVNNTAAAGRGGGGVYNCAYVSNSIVWTNWQWETTAGLSKIPSNHTGTAGFSYSCTTPTNGLTGAGNTSADPSFANPGTGNYTLQSGSPCIDKGSNQAWMDGAKDLAGNARKIYAGIAGSDVAPVVDMGAYEYVPVPVITVSDPAVTLAFGNVMTNTISAETNYTVSGSFLTASVTVTSPPNFEISTNSGGVGFGSSLVLTPVDGTLSATTVYVRFLPTAVTTYSTNISHSSSGAITKTKAVGGSGVAAGAPVVDAVPGSLDFGNVITNKTSVEQTYQVSGSNLTDNVTVTAPAGFWIYTNGGSLVQSLTLTTNLPGKLDPAVTVNVRFAPMAPVSYNASIISNTSPGAVDSLVTVSGVGVVQGLSASGGPLSFGNVVINRTNTLFYTLSGSNLEANVTVTAPSPEFTFSTNLASPFAPSLSLAPVGGAPTGGVLAATTVHVRFIPSSIQAYGGNITNGSVGAANGLVAITGTGIDVPGPYVYVVTNGTPGVVPQEPYNTWARAATNVNTAVSYVNANLGEVNRIILSNGTHTVSAEIALTGAIRVGGYQGGLSGAASTIVKQTTSGQRVFSTANANAVIEGLTITGGDVGAGQGGGVYMAGGLVRDCIVSNNLAPVATGTGGNIYMNATGSTVSNCIITAGAAGGRSPTTQGGGGIFAGGNNKILNCQVINNVNLDNYSMAPGILAQATDLIRNCLIAGNRLAPNTVEANSGKGAGIYGGKVENCTIVSNTCAFGRVAGGVLDCAYVSNSIVYGNYAWGDVGGTFKITNNHSGTAFAYSDTVPTNGLTGAGNIDLDPLFVDLAGGDYSLQQNPIKSPCINAGLNDNSWMLGATDLAGNGRIFEGTVDMGAYESPPVPGTLFMLR